MLNPPDIYDEYYFHNLEADMCQYFQVVDLNFEEVKCVHCPARNINRCHFLEEWLDNTILANYDYINKSRKLCEAYQWNKLLLEFV